MIALGARSTELAALRGWLWASATVHAAEVDREGTVLAANRALERDAGRELTGASFDELLAAPQRTVFRAGLAGAAQARWHDMTLGFHDGGSGAAEDRTVGLRRDGDRVLVVAEPAVGERYALVEQVLGLNEDLIATQRTLGRRQRELERARAEAEAAGERARRLEAITLAGLQRPDLDGVLQALLDIARDVLGAQRAAVLLIDEDTGVTERRAEAGRSGRAGARDVDILRVPLEIEDRTIGVLEVDRDGADPAVLGLVAQRAALAIGHVQLRDREQRMVETLQRSLLPQALPDVDGLVLCTRYLPRARSVHVGGDFYDAVVRPDGTVAIALGDVAGKGLRAASTMGEVRSVMRAYALDFAHPADVLTKLDRMLEASDAFASALCMVLDPASGELRCASAGHPPALVLDADGVRELDCGLSPPLGVGVERRGECTTMLPAGAPLLAYTDGLVERSRDITGGMAAVRTTMAHAWAEDLGGLCDNLLAALGGGEGFEDDVALLAVRRDP